MTQDMRAEAIEAMADAKVPHWKRDPCRLRDLFALAGVDTTDALNAVLDALLAQLDQPSEAMIHHGAAAIDHPSVYMGGPSMLSRRTAPHVWRAMLAHLRPAREGE